ncbi:4a-hydroxytetrahydrobiopterin dehydratase [Leptospira gomenensis]|uniref:4a-hydroxytetrahydrobiopterin dehydratase n=1 Tax=Leptospira gomenensis TaxID=2484974 RepID=A0A5F1YG24_9LEPT|nr:4a-hydroxytetrahydrobiopterin dehydratase [Leptospira gomenensis]TGK38353.1 4a-hydroxytetrahydrobiopterin dehydratase [Leptospira gomenensis]TGK39273.1 4a-hydroxytetrahydrobiopterin dehydratase [Leptospira gomenensis]TGK52167.1 4a-hydroxytetrahydrobiopterin dehydratase [Leptospira gomenensis]TGK62979.1 4a-hydroxytetrahydrobiopterin dehydratase [Leptospira gomenensis]
MELLDPNLLQERLAPGWELRFRDRVPYLFKVYSFDHYLSGVKFVSALAEIAEKMDHHPNILLGYRKVSVEIFTHFQQGITELDLRFSQACETAKSAFL